MGGGGVAWCIFEIVAVVTVNVVVVGIIIIIIGNRVVPRRDFGYGRHDAGRAGQFRRSCGDKGGGGTEDAVEVFVDVGFDVDGVRSGIVVDDGDEDAQSAAEHSRSGLLEVGRGFAGGGKDPLALLGEGDDFGEEDDVFAVQLHARGVDLQAVVIAVQAGVEGLHGVHLALFRGGCLGGGFGF